MQLLLALELQVTLNDFAVLPYFLKNDLFI